MNISERTLIKRINRKLAYSSERLCTVRGGRWVSTLGRYYIKNTRNIITAQHCNIEALARELGVLWYGEEVL